MTDNAQINENNVTINLHGGTVLVLRPTIHAMQMISRIAGGLQGAVEKIAALDITIIHEVLVHGAGAPWNNTKPRAELLEKIFLTGLTDDTGAVAERAQAYVILLMRGGRPRPETEEVDGGGTEGNVKRTS